MPPLLDGGLVAPVRNEVQQETYPCSGSHEEDAPGTTGGNKWVSIVTTATTGGGVPLSSIACLSHSPERLHTSRTEKALNDCFGAAKLSMPSPVDIANFKQYESSRQRRKEELLA